MSIEKLNPLITRESLLEPKGVAKINEIVSAFADGFSGEIEFEDGDQVTHTLTFADGLLVTYANDA